jgi:hypothetical protein
VDYRDEDEVKQALGIKSWANVPKDKVLKFVAMLPQVSKEVALKVAEQLPELRKIATKALSGLEKSHKDTLEFNEKSQEHVHDAYQDIRDVLKGELKEEDLTFDQKKEIYDLLMDTGKEQFAKDSENKRVLDTWLKAAGVVALAALAVCVVLLADKESADQA